MCEEGTLRTIGVSNFNVDELQELLAFGGGSGDGDGGVGPHIVQNWMDPLHQDRGLRALAAAHGIQYQAYSSLGTQWVGKLGFNPVLTHPVLKRMAKTHSVSVPAVVLTWAVQSGAAVIPSSRSEAHIAELFVGSRSSGRGGGGGGEGSGEVNNTVGSGETNNGENTSLFGVVLSSEEMAEIDGLDGTLCNGDVWSCTNEQPYPT
jgi:diketogulonate reductase-like aldo/keto reductase